MGIIEMRVRIQELGDREKRIGSSKVRSKTHEMMADVASF